jgi:flavin reductase (DIM6/NTAB) family NADH-FMN oxidoreductase RutF
MDLPWGDERCKKFITNVGLVTSNGPNGENIMACEWTHHISYSPGLIAVCLRSGKATHENISETKEFGVSITATDQSIMASVAGGSSGKDVDKIRALEELGFKFCKAKKINTLMVEGAVVNIECKLVEKLDLGSHTMFVGEVQEATLNDGKEPLAYHGGKYFKIGEQIGKPSEDVLQKIKELVKKYARTS